MQNICLIIGAGAGIGGNVAKVFAKNDYHVYLTRRSDDNGLKNLIDQINSDGGKASGELLDAVKEDTIENLVDNIENKLGPIDVVVYNLGAQIGNKKLEKYTTDDIVEIIAVSVTLDDKSLTHNGAGNVTPTFRLNLGNPTTPLITDSYNVDNKDLVITAKHDGEITLKVGQEEPSFNISLDSRLLYMLLIVSKALAGLS